jgi:hypothetical protein
MPPGFAYMVVQFFLPCACGTADCDNTRTYVIPLSLN